MTVFLGSRDEPQPDLLLRILPEFGGPSRTVPGKTEFLKGPVELVIEVAHSTRATDLHAKRASYQKNGVQEYLVVCVDDRDVRWFDLMKDEQRVIPGDGVIRSDRFPGLWLDVRAILDLDTQSALKTLEAGLASPEHAEFLQRLEAARARIAAEQPKPQ